MVQTLGRMYKFTGLRQKCQKSFPYFIIVFIIFSLVNIKDVNIGVGDLNSSNNTVNMHHKKVLNKEEMINSASTSHQTDESEKSEKDVINIELSQLLSGPFTLPDDHPFLLNHIREVFHPPSTEGLLKLDNSVKKEDPVHSGQVGQVLEVDKYFEGKTGGFFLEAGAWDGEWLSNTLFLEVKRNWTGLLVEPNLSAFTKLVGRNRNSHCINSCLATKGYPEKVTFDAADVFGGIVDPDNDEGDLMPQLRDSIPKEMRDKYKVQCYPLYSLLMALGNPRVDFFSLDIEGAELFVLETLPWEKVNIEMVMVEVEHSDIVQVTNIMDKAGYKKYKSFGVQDVIYVKKKG